MNETRRVLRRNILLREFLGLPLFFLTVRLRKNLLRPCEKFLGYGWRGSSLLFLEVEESYPCSALLAHMWPLANRVPVLLECRLLSISPSASKRLTFVWPHVLHL